MADEFGPFDLILDDGGHKSAQMIPSFNNLFGTPLAAGGVYRVEDTLTNYWPRFVDSRISFLDFCRGLVDLKHAPYWDEALDRHQLQGDHVVQGMDVPYVQAWLRRVSLYDSIVVIEKGAQDVPVHERR